MSLDDLVPSNVMSTSQLRLSLISRKTEIMKLHKEFPHVFEEDFYKSTIEEIDSFLLYIDGSIKVQVFKDTEKKSAIYFTLEGLKSKVKGFPPDGYFIVEGNALWYYFLCEDQKIVENKYEMLDMQVDGEWRSVSLFDSTLVDREFPFLVGQELRYLVLA
jgi:hypothetical protein